MTDTPARRAAKEILYFSDRYICGGEWSCDKCASAACKPTVDEAAAIIERHIAGITFKDRMAVEKEVLTKKVIKAIKRAYLLESALAEAYGKVDDVKSILGKVL